MYTHATASMRQSFARSGCRLAILVVVVVCAGESIVVDDVPAGDEHANSTATDDERSLETITCQLDGESRTIEGTVLISSQDGGLLVEDRFGELYAIAGEASPARVPSQTPFALAGGDELAQRLQSVLADEGTVVTTEHYVIVTRGSAEFAEWAGAVLDQFHFSMLETWREMGLEPHEPEGLLPLIVLADREEYTDFATRDASVEVAQTRAYYSMRTNRMVLHDPLSEAVASPADLTPREIDRRMAALPRSIGTLLHEATHQLAYNCGLHTRYADNPMWLTEGLAMCAEPSEASRTSVDVRLTRPNADRLVEFKNYVRGGRPAGNLTRILESEDRFRDADTQSIAYSEAWALSWFLIRERSEEYVEYLRTIADKPRMNWDDPATRLAEFEAAFGDVDELERDFLRWIARR
jgi:hypothetical protein